MAKVPEVQSTEAAMPQRRAVPAWLRWLFRVRAYYTKEVNEIRRQPLLILSLIVGPLLVLIIFGASYQNSNPRVRTAIVLPPGGIPGLNEEQIRNIAGLNFELQYIGEDRAAAEADLAAGNLDLVQILPTNLLDSLQGGENPQIEFISNAINPLTEGWIQYLGYAEVNEINKAILRATTEQAQARAADARLRVVDAEGQITELEGTLTQAQEARYQEDIRAIIELLDALEAELPPQEVLAAQGGEIAELRPTIARLRTNLRKIEQALTDGTLDQYLAELRLARQDLGLLGNTLELFVNTSPDRLISPVTQVYRNIKGSAYSAVIFYAPGVLALLVQHTAITLGALALVRERLMGAFEVFRVAPVSMTQLLIGKYLGYTLFIGLSSAILIGAMLLLGVPLLGVWWHFALLILLLTVASLGVGFLISTLAGSDSQAIQLAMITLLLSIFFSGFFIALEAFATPALAVSYSIPMTHGVSGLQNLMLRGLPPAPLTWIALGLIAIVTFVTVLVLTERQFKRA
jgi:ABC-2 type transport system permease protein